MRHLYNVRMTSLEVIAFVLLGVLVAGLLGAVSLLFWETMRVKRVIQRLEQTPCPVCQQPLQRRAVQEARERLTETVPDPAPNAEVPGERPWELVCTHCHSTLMFDARKFAWLDVKHPHEAE